MKFVCELVDRVLGWRPHRRAPSSPARAVAPTARCPTLGTVKRARSKANLGASTDTHDRVPPTAREVR